MKIHSDLQAAYGAGNYPAAFNHWFDFGINEGRRTAYEFDEGYYLNRYTDLQAAFGARNYPAALGHFITSASPLIVDERCRRGAAVALPKCTAMRSCCSHPSVLTIAKNHCLVAFHRSMSNPASSTTRTRVSTSEIEGGAASWPTGCVFVGADAAVIAAAAGIPFPLGPATGFDWDIISGRVEARVNAPSNVRVNSDGSVSATIVADALAQLTLHTPDSLPNVDFGPKAEVSLSATLKPTVVGGQLCLILEGVPIPTFSFDWGIPSWINWLFYPLEKGLAAALNAVLGPLIGHVLSLPPIPIWKIPSPTFDLGGKTIGIHLDSANAIGTNDLLVVRANVTVS